MSVGVPLMIFAMVVTGQSESASDAPAGAPRVKLQTSKGDIVIELNTASAPATAENFLAYVKKGFYDGTVFHRVIPGFMVQGGGFTSGLNQKPTDASIMNEADNGLSNSRGTIAMARTSDPHSATAQFFINLVDNGNLDHTGKNPAGWGYCVFGHVVEGMDVVDAIAKVATGYQNGHQNVPTEDIAITKVSVVE